MSKTKLKPTHPGEMLVEEFLKPMDIGVPQARISKIVKGERGITPDTALRLSRYFNMSAEFWVNLQAGYDLQLARKRIGPSITKIVIPLD